MTDDQINVLQLMPCAYDGWAPALPDQRPLRRSIVIDELVALKLAEVTTGFATRTAAGDAAVAT